MRIQEILNISFINLRTNKIRTFLTMLGIVIGVAAVILIIAIGRGAQALILKQISFLGANTIYIEPGAWDKKGLPEEAFGINITALKEKDLETVEKLPGIEFACPYVTGSGQLVHKNIDTKITFMGVSPFYQEINNAYPEKGRFFTEEEIKSQSRVVVLGKGLAEDLFEDEDPVGKKVKIKKTNFQVIGVLEEQGTIAFQRLDDFAYIPYSTVQKTLLGINHLTFIVAKAKSEKEIDATVQEIYDAIRINHRIDNPENNPAKDDFKVTSQAEATEILGTVTNTLTLLLSLIAAISLIVGGVGIMNIMLVVVTERTREIGLRKAVGARNKDILKQFLAESITLTAIGGTAGIILGVLLNFVITLGIQTFGYTAWTFVIPLQAILGGFFVAFAIGLIFGLYPARKAARLSPIEALRYE